MSIVPNSRPVEQRHPPFRCKTYRKYVASQPCQACGRQGRSNAAHIGTYGRGIKNHDYLIIPLCTARPGYQGCHALFDRQQAVYARKALGMDIDTLKTWARAAYEAWKEKS